MAAATGALSSLLCFRPWPATVFDAHLLAIASALATNINQAPCPSSLGEAPRIARRERRLAFCVSVVSLLWPVRAFLGLGYLGAARLPASSGQQRPQRLQG